MMLNRNMYGHMNFFDDRNMNFFNDGVRYGNVNFFDVVNWIWYMNLLYMMYWNVNLFHVMMMHRMYFVRDVNYMMLTGKSIVFNYKIWHNEPIKGVATLCHVAEFNFTRNQSNDVEKKVM